MAETRRCTSKVASTVLNINGHRWALADDFQIPRWDPIQRAAKKTATGPPSPSRKCCAVSKKHRGHKTRCQSVEHGIHRVDGHPERPAPVDCDNAPAPRATRGGGTYGQTNGRSSIRPSSDGSIPVEKGAQQGSPDALASAVPGPEVRYVNSTLISSDSC